MACASQSARTHLTWAEVKNPWSCNRCLSVVIKVEVRPEFSNSEPKTSGLSSEAAGSNNMAGNRGPPCPSAAAAGPRGTTCPPRTAAPARAPQARRWSGCARRRAAAPGGGRRRCRAAAAAAAAASPRPGAAGCRAGPAAAAAAVCRPLIPARSSCMCFRRPPSGPRPGAWQAIAAAAAPPLAAVRAFGGVRTSSPTVGTSSSTTAATRTLSGAHRWRGCGPLPGEHSAGRPLASAARQLPPDRGTPAFSVQPYGQQQPLPRPSTCLQGGTSGAARARLHDAGNAEDGAGGRLARHGHGRLAVLQRHLLTCATARTLVGHPRVLSPMWCADERRIESASLPRRPLAHAGPPGSRRAPRRPPPA